MRNSLWILIVILVNISGCSTSTMIPPTGTEPQAINDGIEVGTPSEVGLDPSELYKAIDNIKNGTYGEIHSILVYKDGKLVVEEYFDGHDYDWDGPNFHGVLVQWDEVKRHNVHSVGKSITSACVGIALELGLIDSVDDPIFEYLSDYQHLNTDGKDQITIEHLLTMTAGLEWDEWGSSYASEENDVIALWLDCQDPIACVLEKPLLHEAGSTFTYSGGNMILLGEIIENASGMDIEAFSWKYLFGSLEIDEPPWSWINEDVVYAGGDQYLAPREMLKFGILYLNNGVWNQERILSRDWIEMSSHPYQGPDSQWWNSFLKTIPPGDSTWGRRGYGYTWWIHELRSNGIKVPVYFALGFGGQRIYLLPDQEAVVVFTSGNYNSGDLTMAILRDYLIPAMLK
jgi:CubicO group peptidase (beta-lactamase class C family)